MIVSLAAWQAKLSAQPLCNLQDEFNLKFIIKALNISELVVGLRSVEANSPSATWGLAHKLDQHRPVPLGAVPV